MSNATPSNSDPTPPARRIPIVTDGPHPSADSLLAAVTPLFGQDAIDRAIGRAGAQVQDGRGAIVAHLDLNGDLDFSAVIRIGNHVEAQAAVLVKTEGFKFDPAHLAAAGQIVARW